MTAVLACALVALVGLTLGLAVGQRGRAGDAEEFLVAGRRLSLPLASATLFATWFGAGSMLTAADEVHASGLSAVALEPLGAGLCLVLAGLVFAGPLWRMRLLTLGDFFAQRFGPRAEIVSSAVMVPSYFGWIAVQFLALAKLLEHFFGLPVGVGVLLVCLVGVSYAFIGGMWTVAITDAALFVLMLVGISLLFVGIVDQLGGGPLDAWTTLRERLPENHTTLIPQESPGQVWSWIGVLAVGSLGNIPGQDLLARIFAARSEKTAVFACLLAGTAYIVLGVVPVLAGLSARLLLGHDITDGVLPALASTLFTPTMTVVFVLTITATVLSTIDSAILSPATVIAQNLWRGPTHRQVHRTRVAIVVVAAVSLVLAYVGESAYGLLESAYELGLTGLFVPLAFGLLMRPRGEGAALSAMGVGSVSWALHYSAGWQTFLAPWLAPVGIEIPTSLAGALLSGVAYFGVGPSRSRR